MSELRLEREFKVSPVRLFDVVTQRSELLQWWGPEGLHVPEEALDFSKTGPWFSVMVNGEGQRFKVSGQVTHVDAPKSVGFTWGWHDDADARGHESHVTFTIVETAEGAKLIVDHRELQAGEMAESHEGGWTSSLRKLEQYLG